MRCAVGGAQVALTCDTKGATFGPSAVGAAVELTLPLRNASTADAVFFVEALLLDAASGGQYSVTANPPRGRIAQGATQARRPL